jgi:hypothetical protein
MATTEKGPHALTRVGPVPLPSDSWDFDPDVDLPNDLYRGVRRAGSPRRRLPLGFGLVIVAAASVVWFTMPGVGIDQYSVWAAGDKTSPSVDPRDAGVTSALPRTSAQNSPRTPTAALIPTRAPISTAAPISAPTSVPTTQLTGVAPAKVWVGLKNSGDVGTKFDLLAEVYKDGALVTSGHIDNAAGGSSGFNNAVLDTIVFDPFTPIDFPTGSQLTIKLYVRNACTGPTHNSGTARLWYADADANTRFGATIGSTANTYYLLDHFALATTPGPGPSKTMDIAAGAPCSTYKLFGTWTITQ